MNCLVCREAPRTAGEFCEACYRDMLEAAELRALAPIRRLHPEPPPESVSGAVLLWVLFAAACWIGAAVLLWR